MIIMSIAIHKIILYHTGIGGEGADGTPQYTFCTPYDMRSKFDYTVSLQ